VKSDKDFILSAIKKNRSAFQFASEEFKKDPEIQKAATDLDELRFESLV